MKIVAKFGGSSVADADGFNRVKNIALQNDISVVVTSAYGKRKGYADDFKATDVLYTVLAHVRHGIDYETLWLNFCQRFYDIKKELNLKTDIAALLQTFKSQINKNSDEAYVISRGEYFTALLLAEHINYTFVDSADNVIFDYDGSIDMKKTADNLHAVLSKNKNIVLTGFYGATSAGSITLFDRGGSDISGSVVAAAIKADLYQNWTDVDGILAANPKIVISPDTIKKLSYKQLRELSYSGAVVMHESSVLPAMKAGIPIQIKNSFCPQNEGTLIEHKDADGVIGIAGTKGFLAFNIWLPQMSGQIGFIHKALKLFFSLGINIEHIPTNIDGLSIIVKEADVIGKEEYICVSLQKKLKAVVTVTKNISLLAIVGRLNAFVIRKIFECVEEKGAQAITVLQSPDRLNLILGVANDYYETITKALYQKLFREL